MEAVTAAARTARAVVAAMVMTEVVAILPMVVKVDVAVAVV